MYICPNTVSSAAKAKKEIDELATICYQYKLTKQDLFLAEQINKRNMKKELRVKKSTEFETIIKKRKSVANREFVLYWNPNDLEHMRIGLSVGKKIGNAVARNKTKRQVRMMVHELFTKEDHNDYILIVRKPYSQNDFEQNKKSLQNLYLKMKKRMEK